MQLIWENVLAVLFAICAVKSARVDKAENELSQLEPESKSKSLILESPVLVNGWPSELLLDYLGQVSGVSFCPKGYLFIFQRAGRRFDARSFDSNNKFLDQDKGPIRQNTIIKVNNKLNNPELKAEFGSDLFYLPHGIHTDNKYVWATDLGRHQVLRIPHGSDKPDLELGEKFVPGHDSSHFCKPTHAVTSSADGSIFVADGYCNSRVVKFDASGKFVTQFGDKGDSKVAVPHHLVLIESHDLLCVADRENKRVQCFIAGIKSPANKTGRLVKVIDDISFGPVYAIGFNSKNGLLYIVSGIDEAHSRSKVYIYDWNMDALINEIEFPGEYGFGLVHSMSVSGSGRFLALAGLTKECPGDGLACLSGGDSDNNGEDTVRMQARNLWLYGLVDERINFDQ